LLIDIFEQENGMKVVFVTMAVGAALFLSGEAQAGKYNEVLSIGDLAPEWKDLPDVVSGKKHSLVQLKDAPVVVVVFTCNSCPVATDYEERILALAKKFGAGLSQSTTAAKVAVVTINVNKVKDDLPPAMKARAEKKKYPFPYLFDESQSIARRFGALTTPEFFVLDRDRKVVYMGAMDDNSDAAAAKVNYVELAVEAALAGKQPETTEVAPSGCRIRYMRERRAQTQD
jgi:peroxiredoxin